MQLHIYIYHRKYRDEARHIARRAAHATLIRHRKHITKHSRAIHIPYTRAQRKILRQRNIPSPLSSSLETRKQRQKRRSSSSSRRHDDGSLCSARDLTICLRGNGNRRERERGARAAGNADDDYVLQRRRHNATRLGFAREDSPLTRSRRARATKEEIERLKKNSTRADDGGGWKEWEGEFFLILSYLRLSEFY